jgi:hypothetical protein
MTDTTQRDELVKLLAEHEEAWATVAEKKHTLGCSCGQFPASHHAHLADVLLAAGWSKADDRVTSWPTRPDTPGPVIYEHNGRIQTEPFDVSDTEGGQ